MEALQTLVSGCRETSGFLNYIQQRLTNLDNRPSSNEKRELRQQLDEVRNKVNVVEKYRRKIGFEHDISDEPIARVVYPGVVDIKVPEIWNKYKARLDEDGESLIS